MHIVYVLSPGGGPDTFVRTLLPWLQKRGHQVSLVYTKSSPSYVEDLPTGVRTKFIHGGPLHYYLGKIVGDYRAWARRLRVWESMLQIYKAVMRIHDVSSVDVVEVTEGLPVRLLKRHWAVVIRAHGSDWTCRHFCDDKDRRWDYLLIRQQRHQMKQADAVNAVSKHLAVHLSEACDLQREHIQVLPLPINARLFSPVGRTQQTAGHPVILTIGRLERRKGVDNLLRAMSTVWRQFPNTHVYLLGKESQLTKKYLLSLVPQKQRNRVIFPGPVPHFKLPEYYRMSTVYVAPTQYETFGYSILEAMACGRPILSCAVGAVPELVKEGKNGHLVPFADTSGLADKLISLLNNPHKVDRFGTSARKRAMELSVNRIGPLYGQVYQTASLNKAHR